MVKLCWNPTHQPSPFIHQLMKLINFWSSAKIPLCCFTTLAWNPVKVANIFSAIPPPEIVLANDIYLTSYSSFYGNRAASSSDHAGLFSSTAVWKSCFVTLAMDQLVEDYKELGHNHIIPEKRVTAQWSGWSSHNPITIRCTWQIVKGEIGNWF